MVLSEISCAAVPSVPGITSRIWSVVAVTAPKFTSVAVLAFTVTPNVLPFGLTTSVSSSPAAAGTEMMKLAAAVVELVPSSTTPRAASAVEAAVLVVIPERLYVTP